MSYFRRGIGSTDCPPNYGTDDDGTCKPQSPCGQPPASGVTNPSRVGCIVSDSKSGAGAGTLEQVIPWVLGAAALWMVLRRAA